MFYLSSFCILLKTVSKFCEKYESRYKLIFINKEYLIDIKKDKRRYSGVYLDRETKRSCVS
jgi:hypothetical protein